MTANKSTESSQGDGGGGPPPPPHSGQTDQLESRNSNMVFKSGPLFISSKGIGWTSWKKRWFILTQTSLVFFRSDPNAVPQKGSEVNLTLGGIDLNNSGSVVIKADKKLLTVLFPDGRDGRTFTLKAETTEDLYEWKTALENALAQAPNTAAVMGQNGILKNEQADGTDGSAEKPKEKPPAKSLIIGRPILLALEDVDGSPSFLEKALKFIEEHGIKVEGILRQAADVDDVERRIREYEQGKTEFIQGEDAHVIADCIKYFLRELPSSPVPASCCNALLEACRIDRSKRVSAMRTAICETFPEPNRRLLQRILVMMQIVASHKTVNRMSTSAVAACMAPLLLRPLLAGDCEIETNIDVGGDSSIQLLKAAAAANHAQAILITLLEEYGTIFSEGSMSPGLYTDSEECESEGEVTDDDEYYEDDEEDDATEEGDAYTDDDLEDVSAGSYTGSDGSGEDDLSVNKDGDDLSSGSKSSEVDNDCRAEQKSSSSVQTTLLPVGDGKRSEKVTDRSKSANVYGQLLEDESVKTTLESKQTSRNAPECIQKSATIANGPAENIKRPTVWGRTSARKDLSMESMDFPIEEEAELEQLEAAKLELQNKISEEVKGNAALQANLEQRRRAFDQRRLALEQEVARLQEQLQEERDKRKALEAALSATEKPLFVPSTIDEKMKADIEEVNQTEADITKLKEQVDDLNLQLNQQRGSSNCSMPDSRNQPTNATNNQTKVKDKQKDVGGKSGSKDNSIDGAESKNKHESSLSNKHPPHNQQQGQTRRSNSSKSASTHSKKSSAKNEGMNSTSSALTKLTTRLNFLKERRNQIANELHNLDKTRASTQAVLNQERGRASEDSQSAQCPEKGFETEEQSLPNSDKSKKPDNQTLKNQDDSEGHDPRILERGKSEGHVSYVAGSGDHPEATSRTNTR